MKILKLTTKNFKRLGTGEFEFGDGVNVIVGENAAGKSTLLRAVSVALFGVSALPGVAGDVATWGTQSWDLRLEFEHAGVTYCVTRDHRTAKVEARGELVANGNRPATQYVETLLNRTMKDFNLLSNSRQGETTYALNYGAAALQREVERLSGADMVEKIVCAAKALRTKLEAEVLAAGEYLLSDDAVKELESKLVESGKQAESAAAEAMAQEKILEGPAPAAPEQDVKALRRGRESYLAYVSEMGHYRKAKADLEAQIAETGELVDDISLLDEVNSHKEVLYALTTSKRKWERGCDEVVSVEKQLASIEIPEGDFVAGISDAEKSLAVLEKSEAKAAADLTEHEAKIKHLRKHLKDGVCPTCGTVLKDDIGKVKAELEEAVGALQGLTEAHESVQADRKTMQKSLSTLRQHAAVQAERRAQKAKLEARAAEIDLGDWNEDTGPAALDEATEALARIEKELHTAGEHNKTRRKLIDKLDRLEAPRVVPEVTEADVAFAETAWSEYQSALSAWQVNQASAKAQKALALSKRQAAEASIEDANKSLAAHRSTAEAVALKKERATLAERLTAFLRERREFYLTQVWETVLGAASRFLVTSTEGWITGLNIKDGSFLFEEKGAWVPAAEASGAQGAFLGVALRMGLARALDHDRSLMLLDEPTEAMTEENARRLMAGIGAARDQVIVVTHRTTDQGLADRIISIGE